jgi:hypothetical protein
MDTLSMFPYVRAALIGHSTRKQQVTRGRRKGACEELYKECPAQEGEIVNYLNNYNGGLVNQVFMVVKIARHLIFHLANQQR